MPLKEFSKENLPRDRWNSLIGDSLFLSPDFLSLWESLGGRAIFISEEKGSEFVAGLAGVIFGRGRLGRIKFIPDWLYGKPAFGADADSIMKRKFIEELHRYLKQKNYLRADIYNPSIDFPSNLFICRQMSTHVMPIDETEYHPPDPMVTTDIRHGRKEGGEVILLEDEKYLERFFALAEMTASRHGKRNRYKKEFLRKLWELSRKDKRIICPMVLSDDNIAAVHIYLIEKSKVLYWQSYFDKKYNNIRPNYLILDYMIKYSQRIGLREINLGGSPPGAESLIKFKEAWGGKPVSYNYYTYYSGMGKILYRWRGM
jgi:hypothetical protein